MRETEAVRRVQKEQKNGGRYGNVRSRIMLEMENKGKDPECNRKTLGFGDLLDKQ